MHTAARRREYPGLVLGVRGTDGHSSETGVQQLFHVAEGFVDTVLLGERTSAPGIDVSYRGYPDAVDTAERADVVACDSAAADDPYPHGWPPRDRWPASPRIPIS
ncbi:hypothetical protein Ari01nite_94040 [Paractinoplanes rishiriensis]|uniref:Uncharacterized protein n=1 Tax=Paractinoplanes rishiriensis TaxID=1050105 RepID=A0A919K8Z7_9ACTN|nr:hypothetical protein Ari01nite_94040 [Actinoplanes rishiriensis]